MAGQSQSNVLRIAVVVDDRVVDELHQERPGSVKVGRDFKSELAIFDARNDPKDYRKRAPLWLALGALLILGGLGLFGSEVKQHAEAAADLTQAASDIGDYLGAQETEGTGGLGLGLALLGLIPFVVGFLGMQEEPVRKRSKSARADELAPDRHTLFDFADGRYYVDLPPGARGKISLGKNTATVKQLRKRFGQGDRLRVKLGSRSKGKLVLGETTLLFQMAAPAPAAPILPFPQELVDPLHHFRTTGLDKVVFGLSFLLLGGLFFALRFVITPTEPPASDRFTEIMDIPVSEFEKEETEPEEEAEEDVLKQEDEEEEKEEEEVKEVTEKVLTEKPQTYSKQAMDAARGVGVARTLGTYGGPGEGTVFDVIQSTENNLGELFDDGMTTVVDSQGGDVSPFVAGGKGISETGSLKQGDGLQTGEKATDVGKSGKAEKKVKGKLKSTTDDIFGDVDKSAVKATIRRRMSALQHCYEKALRTQPNLKGKMTYTIEINTMGKVTRVIVENDTVGDSTVTACTKAKIKGWRFPTEGAEEASEVTFSVVFSGA